jgi:RND family efflux transporter MFP subunit
MTMRFLPTLLFLVVSQPALAIDLDGQTGYATRLALNSSVSARVESIYVSAGQRVAEGGLLLKLDTTALQAGAALAKAEYDALKPQLEKMLTELEKAQELFDRDSLAMVDLQSAQQNHDIAEANLRAARAKLDRAEHRLSQAEIRSPISGIVLGVSTFVGQYVNTRVSDQALVTVADDRSMVADALIPLESWSDKLHNRSARVVYRKQDYPGVVVEIGREVTNGNNNHPSMRLRVRFDARGEIPAGLPVRITIDDE